MAKDAAGPLAGLFQHVAVEVAGLPAVAIRDFAPALAEAREELRAALASLVGQGKGQEYTAAMHRRALAQVDRAMGAIYDLAPALARSLGKAGQEAAAVAGRHVEQELAALAKNFGGILGPIPIPVAAQLSQDATAHWAKYASSARRYAGQVGRDIKRQLALGLVRGETVDGLANRLMRMGGRGAHGAVEGLFTRYQGWAERLARTEVVAAYNVEAEQAIRGVAEEDPDIRVRWDATMDARVCSECAELDGEVVRVGEAFRGGVDRPPLHPNCRCALVAWRAPG